jgi:hypothetical protein
MSERRPLLALIGLTLCVSIWRMSTQEPKTIEEMQIQQQHEYHPTTATSPPPPPNPFFMSNHQPNNNFIIPNNSDSTLSTSLSPSIMLDMLPKNDFSKLIDLTDFQFTINQKSCGEQPPNQPLLLILVHSAPDNWRKRRVIRETWGTSDVRTRLIFLLGAVNTTTNLQFRIEKESHFHGDIVQGNFYDTYRNLTYKHLMALKWFVYHCPQAQFVLKTDDDVFVHMPRLMEMLQVGVSSGRPRKNLLFCERITNARVKRSFRSKWRVSPGEFSSKFYPDHCPGYSILYSPDVAYRLYSQAQVTPYFWVDDVYITGLVASKLNITVTPIDGYYLDDEQKEKILSGDVAASHVLFIFASPNMSEKDIKELWKAVLPKSDNR